MFRTNDSESPLAVPPDNQAAFVQIMPGTDAKFSQSSPAQASGATSGSDGIAFQPSMQSRLRHSPSEAIACETELLCAI